ncbi:MAG: translation initiation factor IF-2, partial [Candidatus Bathyarchaeia archaeon]
MSVLDEQMLQDIRRKFEEEKEGFRQEIKIKKLRAEERKRREAERKAKEKKRRKRRRRKRKPEAREPAVVVQAAQVREEDREKAKRRKRRARRERRIIDQKAVEENIRRTLAQIEAGPRVRKRRPRASEVGEVAEEDVKLLRVSEFVSVAELAEQMDVKPTDVITKCLSMGLVVTINQRLDMDTITMVADEFGYEVEQLAEYAQDILEEDEGDDEALVPRAPIVTIMGHVDHGKTSLLDYIRNSNIIAGEAGGITQHIGAYEVELDDGGRITFLDTPGHEVFTSMRARGAQVTDMVVLLVAAGEGVMPQTVEAIDHARAAGVPIVVAINKIDLPSADPEGVRRQLSDLGLVAEEWGGRTPMALISAKTGQGVDDLLELLLIKAELLELRANPDRRARGVIIESELDRGRGPVATVLIQNGTLRVGDPFVTGIHSGRVRALLDERGNFIQEVGLSSPAQVLGMSGVPQAGDSFFV